MFYMQSAKGGEQNDIDGCHVGYVSGRRRVLDTRVEICCVKEAVTRSSFSLKNAICLLFFQIGAVFFCF